ncbi:hypothetical protein BH10PLA2_BH10PLA2_33100 [soil metagenome]
MRLYSGLLALSLTLVSGCQKDPPAAALPTNEPPAELPDFASWPKVTEKPVRIGLWLSLLCRPANQQDLQKHKDKAAPHGPHSDHALIVRVNHEGLAAFRDGKPMPAGSVIVKEKYSDAGASAPMTEYAMMIKHPPGYDPEHGDWEYAYVNLLPEKKTVRGRLPECSGCHASVKDRDYLFRKYGDDQF